MYVLFFDGQAIDSEHVKHENQDSSVPAGGLAGTPGSSRIWRSCLFSLNSDHDKWGGWSLVITDDNPKYLGGKFQEV